MGISTGVEEKEEVAEEVEPKPVVQTPSSQPEAAQADSASGDQSDVSEK